MKHPTPALLSAGVLALAGCSAVPNAPTEYGPRGGDYPFAKKAKGKNGFVVSPYNQSALIDVRNFPRGTQVNDPWTGKIFLVP